MAFNSYVETACIDYATLILFVIDDYITDWSQSQQHNLALDITIQFPFKNLKCGTQIELYVWILL